MKIDYSEPRQSPTTSHVRPKLRKEPSGFANALIIVTGLTCFLSGFGIGWYFSQKSAKKAYMAAIEQTSLESSAQRAPSNQSAPSQQTAAQPQTAPTGTQATAGQQTAPGTPTPPLSFYKTLPSGQKSEVLGSGINAKEERPQTPPKATKPAEKVISTEKTAARPAGGSFTVQIASFSLKSEAEAMKGKMAAKGYSVNIVESRQGDKGTWYRVRVGSRLSQDAARELKGKLGRDAIVIPEQ